MPGNILRDAEVVPALRHLVERPWAAISSRSSLTLGSKWDSLAANPALESLADPSSAGIAVLPKTLVIDTSTLPGIPKKIEGSGGEPNDSGHLSRQRLEFRTRPRTTAKAT